MPPKEKPSKKAFKVKQDKAIDDVTFGLKNKNKSKKVQQFITRVEKAVKYNPDAAKAKESKEAKKLAKQLQEEEMRILFNEGISNQFGRKKTAGQSIASAMGITQTNEEFAKLLDEISSDEESDDDNDNDDYRHKDNSDDIDMVLDVVEVFKEKTIEDIIEEQREKLAKEGKVGTPVTAESFAKWRAEKLAKRQADAEARMKAEQLKKKGSKGLHVLTGKELFNYNSSLFVDDDAAIDANEENAFDIENKKIEQEEEEREEMERQKAEAEQQRLIEIAKLEDEENERQDDERRRLASLDTRETFMLGNIIINRIIFDVEEREDLEEFLFDDEDEEDESESEDEEEDVDDEEEEDGDNNDDDENKKNEDDGLSELNLESIQIHEK